MPCISGLAQYNTGRCLPRPTLSSASRSVPQSQNSSTSRISKPRMPVTCSDDDRDCWPLLARSPGYTTLICSGSSSSGTSHNQPLQQSLR